MATFTVTCADGTRCPGNSSCLPPGLCVCSPGFVGVDCTGRVCGSMCTFPNWVCALSLFCGGGTVLCPSGTLCPRHSTCDAMGRCVCNPGFASVTCTGTRCESCPGTAYRCVPAT
jgi:WNT inhibitory factor 1